MSKNRFEYILYLNDSKGLEKEIFDLLIKRLSVNKKRIELYQSLNFCTPAKPNQVVINLRVSREAHFDLPKTLLIADDMMVSALKSELIARQSYPKSTSVEVCEEYKPRYLLLQFEVPYKYKWITVLPEKKGVVVLKHHSKVLKLATELDKVTTLVYNCIMYLEKYSVQTRLD